MKSYGNLSALRRGSFCMFRGTASQNGPHKLFLYISKENVTHCFSEAFQSQNVFRNMRNVFGKGVPWYGSVKSQGFFLQ